MDSQFYTWQKILRLSTHAVTETQTNPQTGQQETVVVRRRITSGLPGAVAGNLAGQAIGSLHRPIRKFYTPYVVLFSALSPDSYAISYVHGKIRLSDANRLFHQKISQIC